MSGTQGPSGGDSTRRGYVVKPIAKLPRRPSVGITAGMSLDGPSALLFYKSAQVVDDSLNKNVLLTSGASMAGEKALCRFADMKVPSVIQNYSRMLLSQSISICQIWLGILAQTILT